MTTKKTDCRVTFSARIPDALLKELTDSAEANYRSRNEELVACLSEYFKLKASGAMVEELHSLEP